MTVEELPIVIVGAGAAGLACAQHLRAAGRAVQIFEATDRPGGRIRTDTVQGFRCDHGFQVLLDSYPEARRCLDYERLQLGRFEPGAWVHWQGALHRVSDPRRRPADVLRTWRAPFVRLTDVPGMMRLVRRPGAEDATLAQHLDQLGLVGDLRQAFLQPWLAGIFLKHDLGVQASVGAEVIRLFARGAAAVPAGGIRAIADQLAARLPSGVLRPAAPVQRVEEGLVTLASGETCAAAAVVVAVDPRAAADLLPGLAVPPGLAVTTVHLSAPDPLPWDGRWLLLDGEREGGAVAYAVPSAVAAGYAPPGRHLVSATVLPGDGGDDPAAAVLAQLRRWFGADHEFSVLRVDRLVYAKPRQNSGDDVGIGPRWSEGIFVCGDYTVDASLDGALRSGHRAAEAILAQIAGT